MGLFSWFKKKQVEAQTADQLPTTSNIQVINVDSPDGVNYVIGADPVKEEKGKIKIKAIFSNKVLTVFLPSGDVITNTDASKEMLFQVQNAENESDIRDIMLSSEALQEIKEIKSKEPEIKDRKPIVHKALANKEVKKALPEILATGEFTQKDDSLYLEGIDVAMPELLAKEFIKAGANVSSEYYDSLKSFWCWCVLNPDPIAREDLFGFLERGDFKITKYGFFLGFRNVVKIKEGQEVKDKTLTAFISDRYINIKTKQKKSPKNFYVFKEDDGSYSTYKDQKADRIISLIGNLADLYNGLSTLEDNEYTDAYTRKMNIKIGTAVKMERKNCDNDPYSECSKGLHVGNKSFGYQSHGNTTILVAVNPMNVVAVPNHDANKMRVCEYMPIAVVDGNNKWLEDADTLAIEEEYVNNEVKNLQELAKAAGKEEAKARLVMGGDEIVSQVAEKLEDLQSIIAQRVTKIK